MQRVAGIASVLLLAFSTAIQVNSAFAAEPVEPAGLPNIIFILADDLGYGDLGASDKSISRLRTSIDCAKRA